MAERMGVRVEVWPVAADEFGIWLLSGTDAWRSAMVDSDSEPHAEVEYELSRNGAAENVKLLHSTSWRVDGPHVILTYMAVLDVAEHVRDTWPAATPVSADLTDAVGTPGPGPATEAPAPRYIDVLLHGIRHLHFLLETDSTAQDALSAHWYRHLHKFAPALAGMYRGNDKPATMDPAHLA